MISFNFARNALASASLHLRQPPELYRRHGREPLLEGASRLRCDLHVLPGEVRPQRSTRSVGVVLAQIVSTFGSVRARRSLLGDAHVER